MRFKSFTSNISQIYQLDKPLEASSQKRRSKLTSAMRTLLSCNFRVWAFLEALAYFTGSVQNSQMKYKNICAAIHNIGHSFTSSMNYVDDVHIIDDMKFIRSKGEDILIDWLEAKFYPELKATGRIHKSLDYYFDRLENDLSSQNVELNRLTELNFRWPKDGRKYMEATDDRGTRYKIYVRETK